MRGTGSSLGATARPGRAEDSDAGAWVQGGLALVYRRQRGIRARADTQSSDKADMLVGACADPSLFGTARALKPVLFGSARARAAVRRAARPAPASGNGEAQTRCLADRPNAA